LKAEVKRLREENAALNVALFHVENGLAHPDPKVRALIKAALAASEGPKGDPASLGQEVKRLREALLSVDAMLSRSHRLNLPSSHIVEWHAFSPVDYAQIRVYCRQAAEALATSDGGPLLAQAKEVEDANL